MWTIARRFGVDPTALARTNGLNVNTPLAVGATIHVPGRLVRVGALLSHVAGDVGVEGALVKAVAWAESQWRQDLVSPTGAIGLMQMEPSSGRWVSEFLAGRSLDLRRATDNVIAGSLLLRHLIHAHAGDTGRALAGYYQGDDSVADRGPFLDTIRYQRTVLQLIGADSSN